VGLRGGPSPTGSFGRRSGPTPLDDLRSIRKNCPRLSTGPGPQSATNPKERPGRTWHRPLCSWGSPAARRFDQKKIFRRKVRRRKRASLRQRPAVYTIAPAGFRCDIARVKPGPSFEPRIQDDSTRPCGRKTPRQNPPGCADGTPAHKNSSSRCQPLRSSGRRSRHGCGRVESPGAAWIRPSLPPGDLRATA